MTTKMLTVSAVTRYIKAKFDQDQHLQNIVIKGEISNFKHHQRGHMYFTLKDDSSQLSATMFLGHNRNLKFKPESGMDVIVKGNLTVYEAQGKYQIQVTEMQPDGIGALQFAFEQLKEKLLQEGLFDAANKQAIPAHPQHIAVITAKSGAAVQDIIRTIRDRYPIVKLTIYSTLVQGEQAKFSLVKRIQEANTDSSIDTIILARGGGSIEDLWAFNEEIVARAIYNSVHPVISGIGHETDFTIADFVSDERQPTPTAAAVRAVPDIHQERLSVKGLKQQLHRSIIERFKYQKQRLNYFKASYAFRYPRQLLDQKEQQLDRSIDQLHLAMKQHLKHENHRLALFKHQLKPYQLQRVIKAYQLKRNELSNQLSRTMIHTLNINKGNFNATIEKLDLLSPLKVMHRGYSLTYLENDRLVKTVNQVSPEDLLTIRVQDGHINCVVTDKTRLNKSNKEEGVDFD